MLRRLRQACCVTGKPRPSLLWLRARARKNDKGFGSGSGSGFGSSPITASKQATERKQRKLGSVFPRHTNRRHQTQRSVSARRTCWMWPTTLRNHQRDSKRRKLPRKSRKAAQIECAKFDSLSLSASLPFSSSNSELRVSALFFTCLVGGVALVASAAQTEACQLRKLAKTQPKVDNQASVLTSGLLVSVATARLRNAALPCLGVPGRAEPS